MYGLTETKKNCFKLGFSIWKSYLIIIMHIAKAGKFKLTMDLNIRSLVGRRQHPVVSEADVFACMPSGDVRDAKVMAAY